MNNLNRPLGAPPAHAPPLPPQVAQPVNAPPPVNIPPVNAPPVNAPPPPPPVEPLANVNEAHEIAQAIDNAPPQELANRANQLPQIGVQQLLTPLTSVAGSLAQNLGNLEVKLSKAIPGPFTKSVLKDIRHQVRHQIANLPGDSDILMQLATGSDNELKFEALKAVMQVKPKYAQSLQPHVQNYETAKTKFDTDSRLHEEMKALKNQVQFNNPTPEAKIAHENRILEIMDELDFTPVYRQTANGDVLNLNSIPRTPVAPELPLEAMMAELSSKKVKMVDSLVQGMKEGLNRSSQRIGEEGMMSMNDVPGYQAGSAMLNPGTLEEIPASVYTNGEKYTLHSLLGVAGGGVVYNYENTQGQQVVLKKDNEDLSGEIRAHFKARSNNSVGYLGAVRSPNNEVFMIMEKADTDLTHRMDRLQTDNANDKETAVNILVLDIFRGMKATHNQGLAHCDLKSENVFLKDGVAQVADFGEVEETLDTHSSYGTPLYNAPETEDNVRSGNRQKNDVWLAGRLAYEMYTGNQTPFENKEALVDFGRDVGNRIFDDPQNPTENMINAMMHPDPAQRPDFNALEQLPLFDAVRDGTGRDVVQRLLT